MYSGGTIDKFIYPSSQLFIKDETQNSPKWWENIHSSQLWIHFVPALLGPRFIVNNENPRWHNYWSIASFPIILHHFFLFFLVLPLSGLPICYTLNKANFTCLNIQGFIDLSWILHAVKCQAASSARKTVAKPSPKYAIFSNTYGLRWLKDIRLLDIIFNNW